MRKLLFIFTITILAGCTTTSTTMIEQDHKKEEMLSLKELGSISKGSVIEVRQNSDDEYEYIISLLREKKNVSIPQESVESLLQVGDEALILHNNGQIKVIKNSGE